VSSVDSKGSAVNNMSDVLHVRLFISVLAAHCLKCDLHCIIGGQVNVCLYHTEKPL